MVRTILVVICLASVADAYNCGDDPDDETDLVSGEWAAAVEGINESLHLYCDKAQECGIACMYDQAYVDNATGQPALRKNMSCMNAMSEHMRCWSSVECDEFTGQVAYTGCSYANNLERDTCQSLDWY